MCNPLHESQRRDVKDPSKEFYEYINEEMDEVDLKPVYGLRQVMYYTAVFEIAGIKSFLDSYPWEKSIKKALPSTYKYMPIISVSTYNLFHDATVLERTYTEWFLNWDWIIKGAVY